MRYLLLTFLLLCTYNSYSQCNGSGQFPSQILNAPNWQDDTIFSVGVYAGEYSHFSDFRPTSNYILSSDSLQEDYLTVTTTPSSTDPEYAVLASGVPPIAFSPSNDGSYYIHVNLAVGCGSENMARRISVVCTDCPSAESVGIGTDNPESSAVLDIESSNQGVSIPSHSDISRDAIGDPVDGLLIYNTDRKVLESYNEDIANWNSYGVKAIDAFPNSVLLNNDQKELLNKWVGRENQKWQLCYQKTVDGSSAEIFHSQCDNLGPTVSILKLSNNRTFGGFTTVNWINDENGVYFRSENAFIFSIDNKKRYPVVFPAQYSTFSRSDRGPTFGVEHDIYVGSNMNLIRTSFPISYAYEGAYGALNSAATQELCGLNGGNAVVAELEVWYFDF